MMLLEETDVFIRRPAICDKTGQLVEVTKADGRGAIKLAVINHQDYFLRMADDSPFDLSLVQTIIGGTCLNADTG